MNKTVKRFVLKHKPTQKFVKFENDLGVSYVMPVEEIEDATLLKKKVHYSLEYCLEYCLDGDDKHIIPSEYELIRINVTFTEV